MGFSRQEHWSGLPFPSPISVSRHCQMFPIVRVGGGGENCPGLRTTIETTTAQLANLPAMQETQRCRFDHWVRRIPWRRAWQSTPVFLPGEFHGQRSLVGYSPRGGKDSDMTKVIEHAHIEQHKQKLFWGQFCWSFYLMRAWLGIYIIIGMAIETILISRAQNTL